MIHVCRVDIGCRYVFDMSDGIDDVNKLKQAIKKEYKIEANDQILLISGGCLLNNVKQKLYGLCAGIEESPIYLIDRKSLQTQLQTTTQINAAAINDQLAYLVNQTTIDDINKRLAESIRLQASYQTLQSRTQLAQQCYEYAQQMYKLCDSTYNDQYWQYQGFLALIANLDDHLIAFDKTYSNCKQQFKRYLENKEDYRHKINEIENYINLLGRIRLLPEIMQPDYQQTTTSNRLFNSSIYSTTGGGGGGSQLQLNSTGGGSQSSIVSSPPNSTSYLLATSPAQGSDQICMNQTPAHTSQTLLEWTNSTDPRHKLDIIIERARDIFENIDTNWWLQLEKRIETIMKEADNRQMKEIEGLTKRLADLNNFLDICKACVARQKEIAESFKANQLRATSLRDDTILNDLCMGHERQLELLKENHQQMVDITKKILKAKLELIRVINSRLNWVMSIQTTIGGEINKNLYIQTQTLKELDRIMKQIEQLKYAPNVYLVALNETLRREKFSSVYKRFLNDIYSIIDEINKFENEKRDLYKQKVQFSYVNNLFPYLNDQITGKQTDFLCKFDQNLPKLSENDIKSIENDVNEFIKENNLIKDEEICELNENRDDLEEKNRFNMKLLEKLSEKIENELNKWEIERETRIKEACKDDDLAKTTTMVAQTTSDSTLFLSTLTDDTQLVNDEQEEQIVLVNKKPSANEAFIKEINDKIMTELTELKAINNKNRQIDDCLKQFLSELNTFKRQLCANIERISEKKSDFYNYLIDNLFNNDNNKSEASTDTLSSSESSGVVASSTEGVTSSAENSLFTDQLDESFYVKLKDNLLKLRELYESKLDNLRKQYEQSKTNYMADRQKQFNDALNKLICDKDKQINELKDELNKTKFNYNNTLSREQLLLDRIASLEHKQQLQMQQSISTSPPPPTSSSIVSTSIITTPSSNVNTSNNNNNNISSAISSSTSLSTIKSTTNRSIELCSCTVNDLVIVVYDSRYDAFKIINQSSPYIHFVHTESLKIFEIINNPSIINSISNSTITAASASAAISESSVSSGLGSTILQQDTSLIHPSESTCELSSTPPTTGLTPTTDETPTLTQTQTSTITNRPCDYLYSFIGHAATNCCSSTSNEQQQHNNYVKPVWFIANVLSKEFCVAKKEANRYHVPAGTRFYRVKVKPYKL